MSPAPNPPPCDRLSLQEATCAAALRHADHCVRELLVDRSAKVMRGGVEYLHAEDSRLDIMSLQGQLLYVDALRYAFARGIVTAHPNDARLLRVRTTPPPLFAGMEQAA